MSARPQCASPYFSVQIQHRELSKVLWVPGILRGRKNPLLINILRVVLYVMYNEMLFQWDAGKNRSNQRKHSGIDFETASRIFGDPYLVLQKDRVIDGEQRWHAIGAVRKAVLLVVHAYIEENPNGEETIRIISAREADPRERRVYLEQTDY